MLRVVPHQVLGKEDAGVEPGTDALVNLVCNQRDTQRVMLETYLTEGVTVLELTLILFVGQSIDLSGEKLNTCEQDRVELPCQVDVIVLLLSRDLDNFLLQA